MPRAFVMFTGGKDSSYALHVAYASGLEIAGLCYVDPKAEDSLLFHAQRRSVLKALSEAYGLPLLSVGPVGDTLEELASAMEECAKEFEASVAVSGVLLSDYQRILFYRAASAAGAELFAPLWRKDQERYMLDLVEEGFRFIVVKISAYGLPLELLGKEVTRELVEEIVLLSRKYGFNPAFEGGEAETLVVEAPLMKRRLKVLGRPVRTGLCSGELLVEGVELV